jgi:hypothetical protein
MSIEKEVKGCETILNQQLEISAGKRCALQKLGKCASLGSNCNRQLLQSVFLVWARTFYWLRLDFMIILGYVYALAMFGYWFASRIILCQGLGARGWLQPMVG